MAGKKNITPPLPPGSAANVPVVAEQGGELSQIYTHVRLPLTELEAFINQYLPDGYSLFQTSSLQLGLAQSLLPYTVSAEIIKPAPLRLSAENNALFLFLPLQAKVSLKDKGILLRLTPLEAIMQVTVKARIQMHLKSNWRLFTRTETEEFTWQISPEFRILGVPVGAMGSIESELEQLLAVWIGKIDEVIAQKLDFRSIAFAVWETLQQPLQIWDEPEMWLRCRPGNVYLSGIKTAGKQLEMNLSIEGLIENATQQPPVPPPALLPLPDVQLFRNQTQENSVRPAVVKVVNYLAYSKVSQVINDHLSQYVYRFFNNLYHLKFGNVQLYASPEKNMALIEAGFSGSMSGKAYLRFNPHYNTAQKTLSLRNFEYELNTGSLLLNLANRFAGQALADKICDTIQELINEQLQELNLFLTRFLKKQQVANVVFTANPTDIYIESVTFAQTHIKAVLALKGASYATVLLNGYF